MKNFLKLTLNLISQYTGEDEAKLDGFPVNSFDCMVNNQSVNNFCKNLLGGLYGTLNRRKPCKKLFHFTSHNIFLTFTYRRTRYTIHVLQPNVEQGKTADICDRLPIRYILMDETPLQLDCKQSHDDIHTSSIVADLFLSRDCALWYYLFVQKNVSLISWIVVIGCVLTQIHTALTGSVLLSTIYVYLSIITIGPLLFVSLVKIIMTKFDFLFLIGNTFLRYIILFKLLIYQDTIGFYMALFFSFGYFIATCIIYLFDAFPVDIVSNKVKTICITILFITTLYNWFRYNFTQRVEDETGRAWKYNLGGLEWDLANISATCVTNESLFLARIVWNSFTHPGYFILIRSRVKQKSLVSQNGRNIFTFD